MISTNLNSPVFRRMFNGLLITVSLSAFIAIVTINDPAIAQQMIFETDKISYDYGDTIEVHVTIENNTDSTLTLASGCTGGTAITLNGIVFPNLMHLEEVEREYNPGQQRSFIYRVIPHVHGLPKQDGEQWIYGSAHAIVLDDQGNTGRVFSQEDSLFIEAPKYYGGRMEARFKSGTEDSVRHAIRDSLGVVEILEQSPSFEKWQVEGHSIDSIAAEYSDDPRFDFIEAFRLLYHVDTRVSTSTDYASDLPQEVALFQNYPNPFNPFTLIQYELQETAFVKLEVLDINGRQIQTLVNETKQPGRHEIIWDASNMATGLYIYRLTAGDFVLTRQMILVR